MAGIFTQAIDSLALKLRNGEKVERLIDTLWFSAVITSISKDRTTVNLRYLDDDNTEEQVPIEEIRLYARHDEECENIGRVARNTLPRPLAGLVEDDYEARKQHVPTVFVHEDSSLDQAVLLNGAENKLAAGGGLRALRYLKS
eukprot:gene27842-33623_t